MEPLYQVSIVAQDLQQEENILQIADALEHLVNVSNDVFAKIDKRLNKNATYLADISRRINICGEKVARLTSSDRSTRVFSAPKYPAMEAHKSYESIFSSKDSGVPFHRTAYEIKPKPSHAQQQQVSLFNFTSILSYIRSLLNFAYFRINWFSTT
jgi:hypothetical protein